MRLLNDAEFAAAMTAEIHTLTGRRTASAAAVSLGVIPDDPNALAAEGGGDDPDSCAGEASADPDGEQEAPAGGPRGAGSWRANWLAEAFREEGLTVVEVEGWKTRGAAYAHAPVVSLFHHTASNRASGPAGGLRIVVYGRAGLAGPIANWLTARNGVIYVIASGIANNAGRGNARTAGMPSITGNGNTFGDEMENDGRGEHYSDVQYTAAIRAHAAVHRRLGWKASRGIGHKEWSTSGKPDPLLDMAQVRRDLATAIARGTAPTTPGGDEEVDQKTADAILAELRALTDFLITGKRHGQSATANEGEYIGVLHRQAQITNDLLRAAGGASAPRGDGATAAAAQGSTAHEAADQTAAHEVEEGQ